MDDISLLGFFEDERKIELIHLARELSINDSFVVPIHEIVTILDETADLDVITALIDILISRFDDIDDELINKWYVKVSKDVKRHFVIVISRSVRSKHMQFLLDQYFYDQYMRPTIRQCAFVNKKQLFMNLARYLETVSFTKDNVETAQQILKIIPRDVILSTGGMFTGFKILDVYYAMPVMDREHLETDSSSEL